MSGRAPRTLTTRELNRALLHRQMLLGRARLSLPRALERMGGLQAQYAPSMYIGLWSRVENLERPALTRALERRTVIQATGDAEMTGAARRLAEALGDGTMRRTEVEALLGKRAAQGVNLWLNLVRAPPSGTWERRRADLYAVAEEWLGPRQPDL